VGDIEQSPAVGEAMETLRTFLFQTVYARSLEEAGEDRVRRLIAQLVSYFIEHPHELPSPVDRPNMAADGANVAAADRSALVRAVVDHVAGMTDRYAQRTYLELFVPKFWANQ
jgi:dGTPase